MERGKVILFHYPWSVGWMGPKWEKLFGPENRLIFKGELVVELKLGPKIAPIYLKRNIFIFILLFQSDLCQRENKEIIWDF